MKNTTKATNIVKSTKAVEGFGEVEFQFITPTFEEVIEKLGQEFLLRDWIGHKIANNAASRIKNVCKKWQASRTDATIKLKPDELDLFNDIEDGKPLRLLDFVNLPRRRDEKPDKYQLLIREKWEGSQKKAAFLAHLGLDEELVDATADEVEAAYIERRDSGDELL